MRNPAADLLTFAIPNPGKCVEEAKAIALEHPGESNEQLAHHAVAQARKWAASAGAATGAIANPLIALPAALADMAAVLRIEGVMAGTIGAILDPISLNQPEVFEADILTIIFPGAISQGLRQLGLRVGQRVTRNVIRRSLAEGLLGAASRGATKRLFMRVSERAIITKSVPLVGAGIGAGWNWLELHAVGQRAIRYYQDKAIGAPVVEEESRLKKLTRMLPWKRQPE